MGCCTAPDASMVELAQFGHPSITSCASDVQLALPSVHLRMCLQTCVDTTLLPCPPGGGSACAGGREGGGDTPHRCVLCGVQVVVPSVNTALRAAASDGLACQGSLLALVHI